MVVAIISFENYCSYLCFGHSVVATLTLHSDVFFSGVCGSEALSLELGRTPDLTLGSGLSCSELRICGLAAEDLLRAVSPRVDGSTSMACVLLEPMLKGLPKSCCFPGGHRSTSRKSQMEAYFRLLLIILPLTIHRRKPFDQAQSLEGGTHCSPRSHSHDLMCPQCYERVVKIREEQVIQQSAMCSSFSHAKCIHFDPDTPERSTKSLKCRIYITSRYGWGF